MSSMVENIRFVRKGTPIPKNQNEKHWSWKGDNVGYNQLHTWVRKHYPPPDRCQICDSIEPLDLVNVTGKYNRDFYNWAYDCRRCHKSKDAMIDMRNRKCSVCGTNETYNRSMNVMGAGRPQWCHSKVTAELLCINCYSKERYRNTEKLRASKIQYHLKNRERILAYMKQYYQRKNKKLKPFYGLGYLELFTFHNI